MLLNHLVLENITNENYDDIDENARTGNHASSVRTIPIASVQLFVPENPRLIDVKPEGSNACASKPYATFPKRLVGDYEHCVASF
jgi:hypothetical protein